MAAEVKPDRRRVTTDVKRHSSGQLLSETDTGVDYLEASIYANAIAESIHDARTSITIGIYAKWGSGKSFLLKHIESKSWIDCVKSMVVQSGRLCSSVRFEIPLPIHRSASQDRGVSMCPLTVTSSKWSRIGGHRIFLPPAVQAH